eukprot:975073_1
MGKPADNSNLTGLFAALEIEDLEAIRNLLSTGQADVNERNAGGQTALHAAKGNSDIVRLLLEDSNIDVNATDQKGDTPLNCALENTYPEVASLLLCHSNIDVNAE